MYSSINGHFSYFYILAIVHNTAMNIDVHISCQISDIIFFL